MDNLSRKKEVRGCFMLLLTAFIWGFAFVAQRVGGDSVGIYTFNVIRFLVGGAVLIPVLLVLKRKLTKTSILGGICCGICLFAASTLQQIGLATSDVGKAGFITALYVILVPIFSVILGRRIRAKNWICAGIAVIGLFLLCMGDDLTVSSGDILLLLCSAVFAVHILVIDHFSAIADGIVISCLQFFFAGICSLPPALLLENAGVQTILSSWLPILYAGVMSCGVAYTLQVIFQKDVEPSKASLILCLESVFSVFGGWIILGQVLSLKELAGCFIMLAAIILAQWEKKTAGSRPLR